MNKHTAKEVAEHAVQLALEYPNFTDEHVWDWMNCGSVPFSDDDLYYTANFLRKHPNKHNLSIDQLISEGTAFALEKL